MPSFFIYIGYISFLFQKLLHLQYGAGLVIVRSKVHDLGAKTFLHYFHMGTGKIQLRILFMQLFFGLFQDPFIDKGREADHGGPAEPGLIRDMDPVEAFSVFLSLIHI